jgi:hypothetical protein
MSVTVKDIQDLGSPNATVRGIAARKIAAAIGSGGSVSWASITGKPSTFPPSAHTHTSSDITDLTTGPTWDYYVTNWSTPPTQIASITGGVVLSYTLDGTTRYRFVPSPYDPTDDAFYTTFTNPTLSGLIVARG